MYLLNILKTCGHSINWCRLFCEFQLWSPTLADGVDADYVAVCVAPLHSVLLFVRKIVNWQLNVTLSHIVGRTNCLGVSADSDLVSDFLKFFVNSDTLSRFSTVSEGSRKFTMSSLVDAVALSNWERRSFVRLRVGLFGDCGIGRWSDTTSGLVKKKN